VRKLKQGDEVIVNTGKDRGRTGTVLKVLPGDRVLVEGVNVVKKHVRPNPNAGVAGGIVEQERPIHRSNVMVYNRQLGKGARVGIRTLEDGRKVRYSKGDGEVIDQ
jgi:large subunit ribosomal protein L24